MPDFSVVTPKPLAEVLTEGMGFLSETFPSETLSNGTVAVDGTLYFSLIPLRAGMTVTNIHVRVSTVAVTASVSKVGLYDTSGNRLGVSADLGTSWESVGIKTHALGTPYVVPTTGVYYAALISKGATPGSFARNTGTANVMTALGANPRPYASQTGQTDAVNPATLGAAVLGFWFAVS